jgi:hypothetical protein
VRAAPAPSRATCTGLRRLRMPPDHPGPRGGGRPRPPADSPRLLGVTTLRYRVAARPVASGGSTRRAPRAPGPIPPDRSNPACRAVRGAAAAARGGSRPRCCPATCHFIDHRAGHSTTSCGVDHARNARIGFTSKHHWTRPGRLPPRCAQDSSLLDDVRCPDHHSTTATETTPGPCPGSQHRHHGTGGGSPDRSSEYRLALT